MTGSPNLENFQERVGNTFQRAVLMASKHSSRSGPRLRVLEFRNTLEKLGDGPETTKNAQLDTRNANSETEEFFKTR